jgi:hypothetical protein
MYASGLCSIDARSRPQVSGCVKAIRQLEAAGHFILPEARGKTGPSSPRGLPDPVEAARDVPGQAGDVQGLRLVLVGIDGQLRIWNELMNREHPQGACVFVGRQLKYLVGSDHGWVGGVGFAASALHLAARERWIGCRRFKGRFCVCRTPDGQVKIPHLWPGQNPPATGC